MLSIAVLMLSIVGAAFILQQSKDSPTPNPNPVKPSGATGTRDRAGSATSASVAKIELEMQRSRFAIELVYASRADRQLQSVKTDLSKLLDSTLHDSVGKRIAGNEQLLLRFRALEQSAQTGKPKPIEDDSSLERDVRNVNAETLQELRASLKTKRNTIDEALEFYWQRLSYLHNLRESAASLPPSEYDLQTAISLYKAELTRHADKVSSEAARKLKVSLDGERSHAIGELKQSDELVKSLDSHLKDVTSGKPLTSQTVNPRTPPLASRDDYNRELEEIRANLIAFTTPGYVQPKSADTLVYHKKKAPYSYSALQRVGALDDTPVGRAILLRIGGSKSATQQNDRPLGNFPRMNSIEQLKLDKNVNARVTEAQRLLRQYGPLMVEDGLLSP